MMATDNLHSRLVGWTKIILPLIALGLLSVLFLFSRSSTEPGTIPFAKINEIAKGQRITAPEFSGVAADGSIIEVAARSALPQQGNLDQLIINDPSLTLDAADGTSLSIVAGEGLIDNVSKQAHLTGLARLETSSGYLMETSGLIADLNSGTVSSIGPLEVYAPFGQIEAGQIDIQAANDEQGQQMNFTKGVRMLYIPQPDPKD